MLNDDHVFVLAFKGLVGRGLVKLELGQPWTGAKCFFSISRRTAQSEVRNNVSWQVQEDVREARHARA